MRWGERVEEEFPSTSHFLSLSLPLSISRSPALSLSLSPSLLSSLSLPLSLLPLNLSTSLLTPVNQPLQTAHEMGTFCPDLYRLHSTQFLDQDDSLGPEEINKMKHIDKHSHIFIHIHVFFLSQSTSYIVYTCTSSNYKQIHSTCSILILYYSARARRSTMSNSHIKISLVLQ